MFSVPGQLDGTDDTDEPVSASGTTPAVSNTQDDNGAASSGASSSGASTSVRPKIRKKSREIEVSLIGTNNNPQINRKCVLTRREFKNIFYSAE